jgi:1,6-anhydro-N-acetylmuramate kinase
VPFSSILHAALARALPRPLAKVNVGGVANVSWIGAEGSPLACHTGPGDGLLDDWPARLTGAGLDAARVAFGLSLSLTGTTGVSRPLPGGQIADR